MKHVTLVGKTGNVEVRKILAGMFGVKRQLRGHRRMLTVNNGNRS